ncbi:MAG: hypothetical protein U0P30_15340 [Vicinamibacterales bacterium]
METQTERAIGIGRDLTDQRRLGRRPALVVPAIEVYAVSVAVTVAVTTLQNGCSVH